MKHYNWFNGSISIGFGMLIFVALVLLIGVACDMEPYSIDTESGDWVFMGESKLLNAVSVFDKNGYWEHWCLEFENGIILNTKEWETKPFWEGRIYAIYYNQSSRKTFLEMK